MIPRIEQTYGDRVIANGSYLSINGKGMTADTPFDMHVFTSGDKYYQQLPNNEAVEVPAEELAPLYGVFNTELERVYKNTPPNEGDVYNEATDEWETPNTWTPEYKDFADRFIYITGCVEERLNRELTKFNMANGTALRGAHNCESWSRVEGNEHQTFCKAYWEWSTRLWIVIREWQATLTTMPTEDEMNAVLDSVPLNV